MWPLGLMLASGCSVLWAGGDVGQGGVCPHTRTPTSLLFHCKLPGYIKDLYDSSLRCPVEAEMLLGQGCRLPTC